MRERLKTIDGDDHQPSGRSSRKNYDSPNDALRQSSTLASSELQRLAEIVLVDDPLKPRRSVDGLQRASRI